MKNFRTTLPKQKMIQSLSIKFILASTLFSLISLSAFAFSTTDPTQKTEELTSFPAINIEGTISTEEGPLPGAIVYLKGSEIGTTADTDGFFKFPQAVNTGDVIVFSFIGYKTYELEITKDTPSKLTIKLEQESIEFTGAIMTNSEVGDRPNLFTKFFSKVKSIF